MADKLDYKKAQKYMVQIMPQKCSSFIKNIQVLAACTCFVYSCSPCMQKCCHMAYKNPRWRL